MMMPAAIAPLPGMITSPVRTLILFREEPLVPAFGYYLAITLGYTLLTMIMIPIGGEMAVPLPVTGVDPLALLLFAVELILVSLVSLVVGVPLVHTMVWLMDGAGTIRETVRLFCYAETPSLVLGWVPVIGWIIATVWSVILLVLGLREYHQLSLLKAIIAVIVPIAAVFLVMVAAVMYLTVTPE